MRAARKTSQTVSREGVSAAGVRRVRRAILVDAGRELAVLVVRWGLGAPLLLMAAAYGGATYGVAVGIATYALLVLGPVVLTLVLNLWATRRGAPAAQIGLFRGGSVSYLPIRPSHGGGVGSGEVR